VCSFISFLPSTEPQYADEFKREVKIVEFAGDNRMKGSALGDMKQAR
jgi:hypothetical protein